MKVLIYENGKGESPFKLWLSSVQDSLVLARIHMRILRIEEGNLGDYKHVGNNVYELRMTFGGGIRIYFGMVRKELVLLLLGGNKKSQRSDILKAQKLWLNYMENRK